MATTITLSHLFHGFGAQHFAFYSWAKGIAISPLQPHEICKRNSELKLVRPHAFSLVDKLFVNVILHFKRHVDRDAEPKDYDISNNGNTKRDLQRSTYQRIGNLHDGVRYTSQWLPCSSRAFLLFFHSCLSRLRQRRLQMRCLTWRTTTNIALNEGN